MNSRLKDSIQKRCAAWWDAQHEQTPLPPGPMEFARFCAPWLSRFKAETLLELGFGQLNDAIWFSQNGFSVYGLDFSSYATDHAKDIIHKQNLENLKVQQYDYSQQLPFESSCFDAVYSHLSLHYFDDTTTSSIFDEVQRVLRKQGLIMFNVKSVNDIHYGEGNLLGSDIYDDRGDPEHIRHFFRYEKIVKYLAKFTIHHITERKIDYMGYHSTCFEVIAQRD